MRVGLVTGTVGIGKSTIGYAVAQRMAARGVPTAFIDVDELSRLWPAPTGDPFQTELILANLRTIAPNYEGAGAELLILAWVVQDAEDLTHLEAALGLPVTAVRLTAPAAVVEARLRNRHQGPERDGLAWHLRRAPELVAIQDDGLALPTVDASGPVDQVADAVIERLG